MPTDDNLDGILSPYLRRSRFRAAQPFIRGRVLDFGCGSGLLASITEMEKYVGVDIDMEVLRSAAERNPAGRFMRPEELETIAGEEFDTVVALAVIEHLPHPVEFLRQMAGFLADHGAVVLTTPNPLLDWAHGAGGRIGLFAHASHKEHQSLMGRRDLFKAAAESGLRVVLYRRFLLGANQLAVLRK